jgi:glycosyltransferase involved in cell wall biosynthesis
MKNEELGVGVGNTRGIVFWGWVMPKVSVCIPTYNRAHFLTQAIGSVQAQTESDWELIICDDGSVDGTRELISGFNDNRIHYIRHSSNIGKSNNMRSGYEAAKGKYFVKFDDDDRLMPEFLQRTCQVLDRNPEAGLVGTDHWVMDEAGEIQTDWSDQNSVKWGRKNLSSGMIPDLLHQVFVVQSLQIGATLWRSEALQELDYMRQDWQNCEDNDLFVRFALSRRQAFYLPERLMSYRFHAEQQGIDRAIPYFTDKLQYLNAYRFEDQQIESIRQSRLSETQLLLGLRLIERGEVERGRALVQLGQSHSTKKAIAGLLLSHVPKPFRASAFGMVRAIVSSK